MRTSAALVVVTLAVSTGGVAAGTPPAPPLARISPSGDLSGVTDHANIANAFHEAASRTPAGLPLTVELDPGTFYLHEPLLIPLRHRRVTLRGAGRVMDGGARSTTLTNAPGVVFPLADWTGIVGDPSVDAPRYSCLVIFYMDHTWEPHREADLRVSNLTAVWSGTTVPFAIEFDAFVVDAIESFFHVAGRLNESRPRIPNHSFLSTTWENLELRSMGSSTLPETAIDVSNFVRTLRPDTNGDGIQAQGLDDTNLIVGRHEVRDVHVAGARFAMLFAGLDRSHARVRDVTVTNPDPASLPRPVGPAVVFSDASDSVFTVTALRTTNTPGSAVVNGRRRQSPIEPSRYLYRENSIHSASAGLVFSDEFNASAGTPTIRAVVSGNAIHIANGVAGLLGTFTEGLTVADNHISGTGLVAMRVAGGTGLRVLRNTVALSPAVAAMWMAGTHDSRFLGNDYSGSATAGWMGNPLAGICDGGPGALLLEGDDHRVIGEIFPAGTTAMTQVCDRGDGNVVR